ncbi:MAG: hypothetical protein LBE12_05170 [Planctomycetaceae bacterium]|jgi:hypothetical protein|nr:hypothetical protein [Planctomycetaceae bacterium]
MRNDYRFGSNPLAIFSTLNFPLSTIILPLQGFGVLYLLRRALPYANVGCPFRAILMNTYLKIKHYENDNEISPWNINLKN